MEEDLIFGLIIVCLVFLFIIIGIGAISLLTEKASDLKVFKKKFNYKKIDNLYEEFIYSNEDKFFKIEHSIRLCYFIVLGDFIIIPMIILYLFIFETTKVIMLVSLGIVLCLGIILHYVYTVELPLLLEKKNEIFKTGLIKYIVMECLDSFRYEPNEKVPETDYNSSKLYEKYDSYFSEDKMSGYFSKNKIVMGEVETLKYDENKVLKPIFHGLYAHINLNVNSKTEAIITSKDIIMSNKKLVSTTSEEFDSYYNTYISKSPSSYELLNKETVSKLIELATLSDILVDIKITSKDVYFRFGTGPLFDGLIFSKDEKRRLYEFSLIVDIIRSLNDSLQRK